MNSAAEAPNQQRSTLLLNMAGNKLGVCGVALLSLFTFAVPASAVIRNDVTATGTAPGGAAGGITDTTFEEVDVEDDAPALTITKTVQQVGGGALGTDIPAGTNVEYVFSVENTGNVTVSNVSINELTFDGDSPVNPTVSSGSTTLAPGETVTFTGTYTVTNGDIADQGGADGSLDNTANATGDSPAATGFGVVTSNTDGATFDLEDVNGSMDIVKTAILVNGVDFPTRGDTPDTANVAVGDVITYEYIVTNDGNVALTNVNLSDDITTGGGVVNVTPTFDSFTVVNGSSNTGDTIDTFGIGSVARYTSTYTVTQADIDELQ
ncbi:MAG: hypothetical protein AAF423_09770 [Pseudomonadota bacterium]